MLIKLQNDKLSCSINSFGSELVSLKDSNNHEYMWRGADGYWDSTSPILFPIVGRLKDGKYIHDGNEYMLPGHGFARTEEFVVNKKSSEHVQLILTANNNTRELYPFEFYLEIEFSLRDTKLDINIRVKNLGKNPMPFSFGLHPGFALNWFTRSKMEDYKLVFDKTEIVNRELVEGGLISTESVPFLKNETVLELNDSYFANDAIVLKNIKSDIVTLISKKSDKSIKMKIGDFPDFAVWGQPEAPFICLEPWHGHGDRINHDYNIWNKEGIIRLGTGQQQCFKSFIKISS